MLFDPAWPDSNHLASANSEEMIPGERGVNGEGQLESEHNAVASSRRSRRLESEVGRRSIWKATVYVWPLVVIASWAAALVLDSGNGQSSIVGWILSVSSVLLCAVFIASLEKLQIWPLLLAGGLCVLLCAGLLVLSFRVRLALPAEVGIPLIAFLARVSVIVVSIRFFQILRRRAVSSSERRSLSWAAAGVAATIIVGMVVPSLGISGSSSVVEVEVFLVSVDCDGVRTPVDDVPVTVTVDERHPMVYLVQDGRVAYGLPRYFASYTLHLPSSSGVGFDRVETWKPKSLPMFVDLIRVAASFGLSTRSDYVEGGWEYRECW